ncbi:MAG: hypothetical protein LBL18_03445 [Bacteroidales bacterium]|jgi:hypothetical protein|nr:hypothetical protein [Bacteroidales bacterium]
MACHKADDDRFDHKYKISKTWLEDTKAAPTVYQYEKGKLAVVRYPDGSSLHVLYGKKFQVKRINYEDIDGNIYQWADITFKENKIEEVKLYDSRYGLIANQKFTIKNGKIAKVYSYNYQMPAKAEIKNILFDAQSLELLVTQSKTKANPLTIEHDVTYTGDNITTVVTYDQLLNDTVTTHYVYDENKNPYYGITYLFMGLQGYSRNNPVTKSISYATEALNYTYSYVYDKHRYPTVISEKTGKGEEGINTYVEYTE